MWCTHQVRRGCSQPYTGQTIGTFLMLKGIFNLTLRVAQGQLNSLFEWPLCAPDPGVSSVLALCRWPIGSLQRVVSPIDSTGLTMFDEGGWKVREHSAEKRRVWYVPVQVAAGGENQSANRPRSGRGSDGVCGRDKQTQYPWFACQKAQSVVAIWGRGRHGVLTDLGSRPV